MKLLKTYNELFESLSEEMLNYILDKISISGIDSLSNHEKRLLDSYSDKNIDIEEEIQRHINKYKQSKKVVKDIGLSVSNHILENDVGRYVKIIYDDPVQVGKIVALGSIYEIVGVQKHWGYVDGDYVPNKIGYRLARVGIDDDFGRVGDVDKVEFINISEEEAIKINKEIVEKLNMDL